ncbi:MAG: MFS transporter [Proteobacteria bacterium]|nr:MFS transporter [Pseudomonadota bacterium]
MHNDNHAMEIEQIEPKKLRLVIGASSLGTIFEWYDFFIFGLLTTQIAEHFFSGLSPAQGYIFALLTFSFGLAVRPLGAVFFGSIGDKKGRKGAFLATVTLMGLSTFAIGFLPDYSKIGIFAPIALFALRMLQGFALGGEYGGAVIYVAEHSSQKSRGLNTAMVQSAAAPGLFGALLVVFIVRNLFGEAVFKEWAWRIPFMVSIFLLAVAIYIRLQLEESPSFKKIKEEGRASTAPLKEVFSNFRHIKLVLLALFGLMVAQGVSWYTSHYYSQVFFEKQLHIDNKTINIWMLIVTAFSAPLYVVFGALSDRIGRKPVMLFGMGLVLLSFYPGFKAMSYFGNPDLYNAQKANPVYVIANPKDCSAQFNPIGKTPDGRDAFASSCDVAKSYLANNGIAYLNQKQENIGGAIVKIGDQTIASPDIRALDAKAQKEVKKQFATNMKSALAAHSYPEKADPAKINSLGILGVMAIFIIAATALFGPLAAALIELFPTRIRYTALSVPYHIGTGIFGGFVPATSFSMVAITGNMFAGLWYPLIATGISFLVTLIFFPETKNRNIHH